MYFFIGILTVFVALSVLFHRDKKKRYQRQLQSLKNNWTEQKTNDIDFYHILKYNNRIARQEFHKLSEQTLSDIDFYDVFVRIDRTITRVGQQYLFAKLQRPGADISALQKSSMLADFFLANKLIRDQVLEILFPLSAKEASHIQSLIDKKIIARPFWYRYLFISIALMITLAIIAFFNPVAIVCLIIPFVVNSIVHFWNKSNTFSFLTSLPQFSSLIYICEKLQTIDAVKSNEARHHINALASFQKKYSMFKIGGDSGGGGDLTMIANYLTELLKAFTLAEVFIFFNLIRELETKQKSIEFLFDYIGEIDTSITIAALRAGPLKTCKPDLNASTKTMSMIDGYHPLVENCVTNSLNINERGILITGSNMSGKTTFLRAVLINSLLAQTIFTCFAEAFTSPILRQYSSIRIKDDVLDGKSLYFQEVTTMRDLVEASTHGGPGIFILDEVFKGTNTVERIAAAKSILSFLNRGSNLVLVATHDLELTSLLDSEFDLYHFTETIESSELVFDHRIKSGHLQTRNAIRVLELSKYPSEIIEEAKTISETLAKNSYIA